VFQDVSANTTFVAHVYLLAGDVLATWAVGAGILWEGEAITVSHDVAKRLVLWGVILETLCSIALFAFDEGISHGQQVVIEEQKDKIIALETKLAPRTLTSQQQQEIAEYLTPHANGTRINLSVYPSDAEGQRFALQIGSVLQAAGFNVFGLLTNADPGPLIQGVQVRPQDGSWHVAGLLVVALHTHGVAVRLDPAAIPTPNDSPAQFGAGLISLWVGVKPLPTDP
jgi:hypothetical protein